MVKKKLMSGMYGTSHNEKAMCQISKHSLQQKLRNLFRKKFNGRTDGQMIAIQHHSYNMMFFQYSRGGYGVKYL